jgi:hypothetical protein
MLNNLHVWVFVKWELKELKLGVKESQVPGIWKKIRIKEPVPVLVISKKPHRTVGFHENPEKRSHAGFWAVILLLQFGIWVSRPRQTDRRDLGFRTSTDRLIEKIARCFTGLSLPPPPKTFVTNRRSEFIYMISHSFKS